MADLIDRKAATQAALEFIVEYLGGAFDEERQKKLMGRMNALPSAQPERITLTEEERRMYKKLRTRYNGSYAKLLDKLFVSALPERGYIDQIRWERDTAIQQLAELGYSLGEKPRTQPEIIRCKDCDWWTKQADSLQGRCARHGIYPTGEWFCAGAERREE